jgi:hypothetical protein
VVPGTGVGKVSKLKALTLPDLSSGSSASHFSDRIVPANPQLSLPYIGYSMSVMTHKGWDQKNMRQLLDEPCLHEGNYVLK